MMDLMEAQNNVSDSAVLAAEDDPNDASLLRRAFTRAGVTAPLHFVRDGREAIDYLLGVPPFDDRAVYPLPTLVLLDLNMPRLSGLEVLAWLRREPSLVSLPVVILTSSWEVEDMRRANLLGATAYHVKPQDPDQLVSLVQFFAACWLHTKLPSAAIPRLVPAKDRTLPQSDPSTSELSMTGGASGARTVLVADDDENDVLFLRRAFQKAGLSHTIIHARNGQEAISCLTSTGAARLWLPDLLLLDLKMPLVDGFDVLGWLRVISSSLQQWGPRPVPVVVLSSSSLPQDKEKAKDLGARDYLMKPVNSDGWITIAKSLNERWLGGRRRLGFH